MDEVLRPINGEQSFRGPLKYAVETTSPQLEAGRNTSIYLLITNPYDVPVKIVYAQTKVPVNFKDISVRHPSFWKRLSDSTLNDQQVVPGVPLSGTGT